MLVWLEQFLVRYPELTLFLVIAAGYWIGSFKIGAFSFGPVTGELDHPAPALDGVGELHPVARSDVPVPRLPAPRCQGGDRPPDQLARRPDRRRQPGRLLHR